MLDRYGWLVDTYVGDSVTCFLVYPVLDLIIQGVSTGVISYAAGAGVGAGAAGAGPSSTTSSSSSSGDGTYAGGENSYVVPVIFTLYGVKLFAAGIISPFNKTIDFILDGGTCVFEALVALAALLMNTGAVADDPLIHDLMLYSSSIAVLLPFVSATVDTMMDLAEKIAALIPPWCMQGNEDVEEEEEEEEADNLEEEEEEDVNGEERRRGNNVLNSV